MARKVGAVNVGTKVFWSTGANYGEILEITGTRAVVLVISSERRRGAYKPGDKWSILLDELQPETR